MVPALRYGLCDLLRANGNFLIGGRSYQGSDFFVDSAEKPPAVVFVIADKSTLTSDGIGLQGFSMSVRPVDAQRSFYHTDYLAGNLFGPANRYRLFREKIWPKLLELAPKFEALYCAENGRPPIDPVLLCGVTLLQFMEKVADRRASEQVVYHLGWKYALDLELDYDGFHATVLVYFRDRLEEKKAERLIFDGVVDLLIELGLVKRNG